MFPLGTMRLFGTSSSLWEIYTKTCPKSDKFFTTISWCHVRIPCQVVASVKEIKVWRGSVCRFGHWGDTFPLGTMRHFEKSPGLWEVYIKTCPKSEKYFTTEIWCHVITPYLVSLFSGEFWIYGTFKPSLSMFKAEPWLPDFCNSFQFLEWDLNIHPMTHIWFFNPVWCTVACACSSNLNCAH